MPVPLLCSDPLCLRPLCAAAADTAVVEEIVAKCNGDIVTRGDIEHSRQRISSRYAARQRSDFPARSSNSRWPRSKHLLRTASTV